MQENHIKHLLNVLTFILSHFILLYFLAGYS